MFDSQNRQSMDIMAPDADVYANVFVMPISASVVSQNSVSLETVNPIGVGLAVLDRDAQNLNKNMIVVGGPCVNTVASQLMGNPSDCTQGFTPNNAMIRYFPIGDNTALLVAGYGAQDTLGAANVLTNYAHYNLTGSDIAVNTTSINNPEIQ